MSEIRMANGSVIVTPGPEVETVLAGEFEPNQRLDFHGVMHVVTRVEPVMAGGWDGAPVHRVWLAPVPAEVVRGVRGPTLQFELDELPPGLVSPVTPDDLVAGQSWRVVGTPRPEANPLEQAFREASLGEPHPPDEAGSAESVAALILSRLTVEVNRVLDVVHPGQERTLHPVDASGRAVTAVSDFGYLQFQVVVTRPGPISYEVSLRAAGANENESWWRMDVAYGVLGRELATVFLDNERRTRHQLAPGVGERREVPVIGRPADQPVPGSEVGAAPRASITVDSVSRSSVRYALQALSRPAAGDSVIQINPHTARTMQGWTRDEIGGAGGPGAPFTLFGERFEVNARVAENEFRRVARVPETGTATYLGPAHALLNEQARRDIVEAWDASQAAQDTPSDHDRRAVLTHGWNDVARAVTRADHTFHETLNDEEYVQARSLQAALVMAMAAFAEEAGVSARRLPADSSVDASWAVELDGRVIARLTLQAGREPPPAVSPRRDSPRVEPGQRALELE